MSKHPTYTWTHVKARLKELQQDDFLLLLHDLYALNADNKVFLATCFFAVTPDEMAAPYRRIIRQAFSPDRCLPSLHRRAARKTLTDFRNVCSVNRQKHGVPWFRFAADARGAV